MKLFALAATCVAVLCAQAPLQLPINSLPPDTVVATSAGKPITAGEVRSILESGDPQAIGLAKNNPEQFLGSLFFTRYLNAEAEKQHLADQSPLKEQLAYFHDRFVASAMMNQIRENYIVPDHAIDDFYAHNQSRFEMARIKVIAIGFCPVPATTGTSEEEIRKAAQEALAAAHCTSKRTEEQAHDIAMSVIGLIRGGADFVKMVAQYSEDADSKATEGDFGLVTRDNSFKPEIKQAVFALKDGEVSDPIRSGDFFYIIKIKERSVQPLSNVREQIVQELKQKHFTDWLDDLSKRLKPVISRPDFFTAGK
jgi:peptidyl-prolyl cis-trans isomerase C